MICPLKKKRKTRASYIVLCAAFNRQGVSKNRSHIHLTSQLRDFVLARNLHMCKVKTWSPLHQRLSTETGRANDAFDLYLNGSVIRSVCKHTYGVTWQFILLFIIHLLSITFLEIYLVKSEYVMCNYSIKSKCKSR